MRWAIHWRAGPSASASPLQVAPYPTCQLQLHQNRAHGGRLPCERRNPRTGWREPRRADYRTSRGIKDTVPSPFPYSYPDVVRPEREGRESGCRRWVSHCDAGNTTSGWGLRCSVTFGQVRGSSRRRDWRPRVLCAA
jgi:hypothetical protein